MSVWFGYSLLALVLWGLWGIFSKIAAASLPSWAIFLVEIACYLLVGGVVWGFFHSPVTWNLPGIAAAIAAGLCGSFAVLCFLKALAIGPASVIVPFTSLYPVITVVLGIIFLRESLTVHHLAGIVLAILAVWLLSQ